MASVNSRRIVSAVLTVAVTATLLYFGTGLFPKWPLMWFAPLPILLFAPRSSWWATGLTAFLAWFLGALNLHHFFSALIHIPLAIQIVIYATPALVFSLSVLLFRRLLRAGAYRTALVAFPAAYTTVEYLLTLASPHGTAGSLAYSQLNFLPFLQLASITGPSGMTFFLLLFSSGLAVAAYLSQSALKQALRTAVASTAIIGIILVFGVLRLSNPTSGPTVKVGLIATDLPEYEDVMGEGAATQHLLQAYASQAELLAAKGAQAIVIPEKIGVIAESRSGEADRLLQILADKTNVVIVVGLVDEAPPLSYNQARVYSPHLATQTYDKHHMLPPFESRFKPGTTLTTMDVPSGKWGVEICKDMDFTPLSRDYGRLGAGLMLVPAWDFVLDRFQHGHIAVMRGVEDGFSIARAARDGYLTVSDNRGRILAETRSNSSSFATLLADVPTTHDSTIYLRFGDWFSWLTIAILAGTLVQLIRARQGARA